MCPSSSPRLLDILHPTGFTLLASLLLQARCIQDSSSLSFTVEQSLTPPERLPCGKQAFPCSRPRAAEEWAPRDGGGVRGWAETQCWLGWALLHHVLLGFPSQPPGVFSLHQSRLHFPHNTN